jgi:hypothetical protein
VLLRIASRNPSSDAVSAIPNPLTMLAHLTGYNLSWLTAS